MRKSKKTNQLHLFLCLLTIIILLSGAFLLKGVTDKSGKAQINNTQPPPIELSSANMVLMEGNKELYQKKGNKRIYPASLTKIMTVYLALSQASLDDTATVPEDIFRALALKHASMAGFSPGETVPVRDLIYGTMLASGADSSEALAIHIAGSTQNFVEMMNREAKKIGMNKTHFTNVTGLHDTEHYTTARDIAQLLRTALKNDKFREIFTAKDWTTSPTSFHVNGITLQSLLFTKDESYEGLLGGKTGYTKEAGLCLASLVEKNGNEYIIITAGAKGSPKTKQYNIIDSHNLYEKAI